jgi:hypothetical protein
MREADVILYLSQNHGSALVSGGGHGGAKTDIRFIGS